MLTLCMLVSASGALATATVTVSSGSVGQSADTGVASLASVGGALYTLYQSGRLTLTDPATKAETELGAVFCSAGYGSAEDVNAALAQAEAGLVPADLLFVDQGALYGLCTPTGAVYALLDSTGAFAPVATGVTLDSKTLASAGGEGLLTVLDHCAQNGALYLVTRDDAAGSAATTVRSFNLSTGEAKTYAAANVQNLCPYKDGLLLARTFDMAALYTASSSGSIPASGYGTFDPATDTLAPLGEIKADGVLGGYAISGLVYSAANDTAYYISGSRVEGMTVATGETRTSAYTGEGMLGNLSGGVSTVLADGGYYVMGDSTGRTIYALDTESVKNGALRIFGEFGSDAHKSFAKNYPDIPTEVATDYTSDIEAIANAMVSTNDAYDVLLMIMSYMPVEKLIAKGYCTDLSAYPEITERVAKLDKRFVDGVTVDGKLYGVPVNSTAFTYGVNMEQWEALGLTEADLPTNLIDFYDFLANYTADYGEDHPDLRLFDMGGDNLKTMLFSLMLDNYITYCQAELGGKTEFDTDMCREILTAYEAIDFQELADNDNSDAADYASKPSLFSVYMPLTTFSSQYDDVTPLILSLTPDTKPVLGANLSVLVINPKSTRKDDAVKYLCNYLDNLDDSSAIVLNPEDNEPRVDKNYESSLKAVNDEIAKQQALLDAADDSHKAGIQDQLTQLEAQLQTVEDHKYSVTAEQIERFRNVVSPLLAVCQQSVLYSSDKEGQNELNTLILQYISGTQTQDQFLMEMDKRARMMALENQ